MKMLMLALILISFSGLSQARSWEYKNHDRNRYNNHHSRDNGEYFWQNVEKRRHNQYSRINHGIETGQLTRREIKQLKREKKYLAKEIKHYKRHNYKNRSYNRNILRSLDHYSDQIYRLKHNQHYARRNRHDHQQYARHDNPSYSRYNNKYAKHGRISQSRRNNPNYYRNNGFLSHTNSNFSSGIYFRF